MTRAILYLVFLALALTVMSAPTKKPRTKCTKANPGALKAARASLSKAAPLKAAPPKAAPKAAGKAVPPPPVKRLGPRATDTTLCGMKIRGSSSGMCQNQPGYLVDDKTKVSTWTAWDAFKDKLPGNVPAKYQCDHALELQLDVKALEGAGFCVAWNKIQALWTKHDPKANAKKLMEEEFFRSLKPIANSPQMLFYIDTKLNGEKRAFTANVLAGRPNPSSAQMKGYFKASVMATVDSVAKQIDTAAVGILSRVAGMAAPPNFDMLTSSQADSDYVCALDMAETDFKGENKPVEALWNRMKADIKK